MKLILCEGDSWTSGDIINPKLNHSFVNHPDNDSYRLPKSLYTNWKIVKN